MILLFALISCRSPGAPPVEAPALACPAAEAFVAAARGGAPPAAWLVERARGADVLALGEFHGLAPQIQLVSEVIAEAAAAGLPMDLGAELLPASRQAALDAMVSQAQWSEAPWAEVVAGRPLLGPLALADYLGPVKAAWTASRVQPTRVVGLSPACDFATAGDADGAVSCLMGREGFMASQAETEVLGRGRKLLLSAGFHHTARIAPPGGDVEAPTAVARLAEGHRVYTALLAGPVAEGPDGAWVRACDGLLDAVGAARGGAPYAADLHTPPWDGLPLSCLGDPAATGALSSAFDAVIWLGDPAAAAGPTALSPAFFQALDPAALKQWNRFEVELQGAPAGHLSQGADVWAGTAIAEARRYAGLRYAAGAACEPPAP